MVRKVLAVVLGAIVAFALVALIEALGHAVYPPPADLALDNPEQLRGYVESLPAGALLFVLAAWSIATLAGGLVACRIARGKPLVFAGIIGALILAGTIANLIMIPHPLWFSLTAVVAIVVMTLVASRLGASPAGSGS